MSAEPKKLTGLQKPLNISADLAKIIGTKKGEQVLSLNFQYFYLNLVKALALGNSLLTCVFRFRAHRL